MAAVSMVPSWGEEEAWRCIYGQDRDVGISVKVLSWWIDLQTLSPLLHSRRRASKALATS